MKKISAFILLVFFTSSTISLFAKPDSVIQSIEYRLKKIEDYRLLDDKKFENKSKELDLKLEEYRIQKSVLDWIALSVGGITILSLWALWLKAKSYANKKIEEKFDVILDEKKQHILSIIKNHDTENKLKQENIIYVISSTESKTEFLSEFFSKLGFKRPVIKKVEKYTAIDEELKYDILLLFREEGNAPLSDEISKLYIDHSRTDSVVFIFGKQIDLSTVKKRSSSATFWSQLHGNLISALKYQELID